MSIFKSISDSMKGVASLVQGATGILGKAGEEGLGKGFKGIIQDFLDLNPEDLMQAADAKMGAGVMKLTTAGDTESVETVIRFRNFATLRMDEIVQMGAITERFGSEDMSEVHRAVDEMNEMLENHMPEMTCSAREESLSEEISKLKDIVGMMTDVLDNGESPPAAGPPPLIEIDETVTRLPGGIVLSAGDRNYSRGRRSQSNGR